MRFYKYKLIRKFKIDFWGQLTFRAGYFGVPYKHLVKLKGLVFRPDIRKRRLSGVIGASGFKAISLTRKKLQIYYGGLTNKEYRLLFKQALKMNGNLSVNLVAVFELQLYVVAYRMGFATTLRQALVRTKLGYYCVNKQVIFNPKVVVAEGSVVEVVLDWAPVVYYEVWDSLHYKTLIANFPKYLEVDYPTLKGLVLYNPVFSEVPYPFYVNPSFFAEDYFQKFR